MYQLVLWIHILSATLLFGTGLGTAFHGWMAHRSGDVRAIVVGDGGNVVLVTGCSPRRPSSCSQQPASGSPGRLVFR